jgi:hypothetical protein
MQYTASVQRDGHFVLIDTTVELTTVDDGSGRKLHRGRIAVSPPGVLKLGERVLLLLHNTGNLEVTISGFDGDSIALFDGDPLT